MIKKHVLGVTLLLIAVIGTASRCHEDPEVRFDYSLECSEDLLDYVTPVVTYTDNTGIEQVERLTKDKWEKSGSSTTTTITVKNGTTESTMGTAIGHLVWKKAFSYDHFDVRSKMVVKYEKNENQIYGTKNTYDFSHQLNCSIHAEDEDRGIYNQYLDAGANIITETIIGESDIVSLIEEIVSLSDSKVYYVDKDGKITKE